MEIKPNFCSECGAKLTGSAKFCPVCGAMQEFAAATQVEVAPVFVPVSPVPAAEPIAEPAPVVEPVTEQVVPVEGAVAKEEVAPVAAPENSLAAPKAKISVIGLILAIFALSVTFFTELTDLCLMGTRYTYGVFDFGAIIEFLHAYLQTPQIYISLLTAWVLPIAAVVLVFWKKRPAALAGLIATGVILPVQIALAAYYPQYIRTYGGRFPRLWFSAYQLFNGEYLFQYLRSVFSSQRYWQMYMHVSVQLNYVMKNIWVLLACLFAAIKKQK